MEYRGGGGSLTLFAVALAEGGLTGVYLWGRLMLLGLAATGVTVLALVIDNSLRARYR